MGINYPPGFRFMPTDAELIGYLLKKISDQHIPFPEMRTINVYEHGPRTLTDMHPKLGPKEWYFFTQREKRYRNGSLPNRWAGSGYWKATASDKLIISQNRTIGAKKTLVFYEGKPSKGVKGKQSDGSKKTNWIMHEYKVHHQQSRPKKDAADDMKLDEWVLCRIFERIVKENAKSSHELHSADDQIQEDNPVHQEDNPVHETGATGLMSENLEPVYHQLEDIGVNFNNGSNNGIQGQSYDMTDDDLNEIMSSINFDYVSDFDFYETEMGNSCTLDEQPQQDQGEGPMKFPKRFGT